MTLDGIYETFQVAYIVFLTTSLAWFLVFAWAEYSNDRLTIGRCFDFALPTALLSIFISSASCLIIFPILNYFYYPNWYDVERILQEATDGTLPLRMCSIYVGIEIIYSLFNFRDTTAPLVVRPDRRMVRMFERGSVGFGIFHMNVFYAGIVLILLSSTILNKEPIYLGVMSWLLLGLIDEWSAVKAYIRSNGGYVFHFAALKMQLANIALMILSAVTIFDIYYYMDESTPDIEEYKAKAFLSFIGALCVCLATLVNYSIFINPFNLRLLIRGWSPLSRRINLSDGLAVDRRCVIDVALERVKHIAPSKSDIIERFGLNNESAEAKEVLYRKCLRNFYARVLKNLPRQYPEMVTKKDAESAIEQVSGNANKAPLTTNPTNQDEQANERQFSKWCGSPDEGDKVYASGESHLA